jgi:hypothetical protein
MVLSTDKSYYFQNQSPLYNIVNAPANCSIYWSSWHGNVSTGEVNAYYGHVTNIVGSWSGWGSPWTGANFGYWVKQATVGGQTATVSFFVDGPYGL